VDITARAAPSTSALGAHSTSPGNVGLSLGGVARNVAEAAHRLLAQPDSVQLVTAAGSDSFGRLLEDETSRLGMRVDGFIRVPAARTAVCNMILDDRGSLVSGVADMDVVDGLESGVVSWSLVPYH
jgi:pseudouridylate synthase / pseudouridine kinase